MIVLQKKGSHLMINTFKSIHLFLKQIDILINISELKRGTNFRAFEFFY